MNRTCNPVLLIPLILPGKYRIRYGRYNSPPRTFGLNQNHLPEQIKNPAFGGVNFLLARSRATKQSPQIIMIMFFDTSFCITWHRLLRHTACPGSSRRVQCPGFKATKLIVSPNQRMLYNKFFYLGRINEILFSINYLSPGLDY